ncbi:HupE/UreJ family protein [Neptuniibacter halophilus]|uniref:HupE/UreJ family protein n=1 Tax=Neptuniibacter halophilus TaxID=651666 RepID=UPI0025744BDA|nr:HupE/UreJ family protein [Neptuniibacter halophilus]
MLKLISKLTLTCLLLLSAAASAHDARPLYLQIDELESATPAHHYLLKLQVPPSVDSSNRPYLILPDSCLREGAGLLLRVQCSESLASQVIGFQYPDFNPSISTLIRISFRSGEQYQTLLSPSESQWQVPTQIETGQVISDYTVLGIEHILIGWDHLLFLLCLLLISGTLKRTLITVSGFTLAHSLTLVLTTLGIVRLPIAPVEAVIALSILFLAAEIARGRSNSLAWRYPVAISLLFGLIHGFGFAAVLGEIGLPQTEMVTALLFFNIGVEIGQLLFIFSLIGLFYFLRRIPILPLPAIQQVMIYSCGALAAFWTIERIAGF